MNRNVGMTDSLNIELLISFIFSWRPSTSPTKRCIFSATHIGNVILGTLALHMHFELFFRNSTRERMSACLLDALEFVLVLNFAPIEIIQVQRFSAISLFSQIVSAHTIHFCYLDFFRTNYSVDTSNFYQYILHRIVVMRMKANISKRVSFSSAFWKKTHFVTHMCQVLIFCLKILHASQRSWSHRGNFWRAIRYHYIWVMK